MSVTSFTKLHIKGCLGGKGGATMCKGITKKSLLCKFDLRGIQRNTQEEMPDKARDSIVRVLAFNTLIDVAFITSQKNV